jgi:hypothetical protein
VNLEILLLRIVHVLGGIFWVGSALFTSFFLIPALASAGPAAGAVMGGLQRRRLFTVLPVVAVLTMLSGVRLMQITSAGFSPEYFASPSGRMFAWGGLFAIVGFAFGMLVNRPLAARLGRLGVLPPPAGPEELASRNAERERLQRRAATAGAVNIVILLAAALAMATARYL